MAAVAKKDERLNLRVASPVKTRIARAAELQGKSISDFALDSARVEADRVIREHENWHLSSEDAMFFIDYITSNEEPKISKRRESALARHKENVLSI